MDLVPFHTSWVKCPAIKTTHRVPSAYNAGMRAFNDLRRDSAVRVLGKNPSRVRVRVETVWRETVLDRGTDRLDSSLCRNRKKNIIMKVVAYEHTGRVFVIINTAAVYIIIFNSRTSKGIPPKTCRYSCLQFTESALTEREWFFFSKTLLSSNKTVSNELKCDEGYHVSWKFKL